MENYTLGPPLETYGPNPRTVGIIVVIGGMFCGFAFAIAADVQGKTARAVFFGMTAVFAGLLLHHLLSRVWVHDSGISFRGLFGYGELCWQDVDRIYFRWEEIAGYDFTSSHVGFHRFEKRFSVNVGTERVLDGVMRKVWQRGVQR